MGVATMNPALILFAPFEASALDRDDNTLSLFRILEGVNVELSLSPREAQTRINVACKWVIVSIWHSPVLGSRQFEARPRFLSPEGEVLFQGDALAFHFETHFNHRLRMGVHGLPLAGTGLHRLCLDLRSRDPGGDWCEWEERGSFPFQANLSFTTTDPPAPPAPATS